MKNYTKTYLKAVLRDYQSFKDDIERRRESVHYPNNVEEDENIGGGRSGFISRPTERLAVQLNADPQIVRLSNYVQAIETTLKQSPHVVRQVIEDRFFRNKTQEETAEHLKVTIAVVRNSEQVFLDKLARRLSLI